MMMIAEAQRTVHGPDASADGPSNNSAHRACGSIASMRALLGTADQALRLRDYRSGHGSDKANSDGKTKFHDLLQGRCAEKEINATARLLVRAQARQEAKRKARHLASPRAKYAARLRRDESASLLGLDRNLNNRDSAVWLSALLRQGLVRAIDEHAIDAVSVITQPYATHVQAAAYKRF